MPARAASVTLHNRLSVARRLTDSCELLIWMTIAGALDASQASLRSKLIDPYESELLDFSPPRAR